MADSRPTFRTPWFSFRTMQLATGRDYFIMDRADAAVIVPYSDAGQTLLLQQARPTIDGVYYEFPMGMAEAGEDPATAAARELREETRLTSAQLRSIGWYYPATALTAQRIHLFTAKIDSAVLANAGHVAGEDNIVGSIVLPLAEIDDYIAAGKIKGASTLMGWYRARRHLL